MDERAVGGLARLDLRSLWKNASWTLGSVVVATTLLFAETILLARFLGATVLGCFVLIRAHPEAVQQVLECRTHETVVKAGGRASPPPSQPSAYPIAAASAGPLAPHELA